MLPIADQSRLPGLVAECLASGVALIAVWGADAARVEGEIDDILIGDGKEPGRLPTTTAHSSDEDAIAFALNWNGSQNALVMRI